MKKIYVKPVMWTVGIQQTAGILQNGSIEDVKGNTGLEGGGEGSEPARSRLRGVWDDEEDTNDAQ